MISFTRSRRRSIRFNKNSPGKGAERVANRIRTGDIQNHNLAL
jgi:hypothetical protein